MYKEIIFDATENVAVEQKILAVANDIFASLKSVSPEYRADFPPLLRTNNFALSIFSTRTHAFLEVSTKSRALSTQKQKRIADYRNLFTSIHSGKPAAYAQERSRLMSYGGTGQVGGGYLLALGEDISLAIWGLTCTNSLSGIKRVTKTGLLYVVGYGPKIHPETAWEEFDAMIRVTFSKWHSGISA